MDIRVYIQGQDHAADRDLFGELGPLLTNNELHKKLGMPITSREGDIWLLVVGPCLQGFALLRMLKGEKNAHVRYLHARGDECVELALLEAALAHAARSGARIAHTNDRRSSTLWARAGFTPKPSNRRGEFVRWELNMENRDEKPGI